METAAQIAGVAVIGGAVVQMTLLLLSSFRRRAVEAERRGLELELFRERSRVWLEIAKSEQDRARLSWSGARKFVVARRVEEAENVVSFYLVPHDRNPIPPFRPGQHLTFRVRIPGQPKPVTRCYSLSDAPGAEHYRVTVKKLVPEAGSPGEYGLVSAYFHDSVHEGDILDVLAPSGHFHLDEESERPVVLIGAGVGITPLASMAASICSNSPHRQVWLFYGVRNRRQHIMRDQLDELVRVHDNLRVITLYSAPDSESVEGEDYVERGHVTVGLLRRHLPSNNFEFYVCGPPAMMQSIVPALEEWGVPDSEIRFEAFGPASVARRSDAVAGETVEVVFARSGKTVQWAGNGSLLDLATSNDVVLDSGCCAGSCGTCITAIKEGDVRYIIEPGAPTEKGSCLTCVAVPNGRLVLDA